MVSKRMLEQAGIISSRPGFAEAGGSSTADDVKATLSGRKTKTAGVLKLQELEPDLVTFEPHGRQRLDHYGNDGDGWDSEGWESKYAGPLRDEVEALLKSAGVKNWIVDIGGKGHVEVQPNRAAMKEFSDVEWKARILSVLKKGYAKDGLDGLKMAAVGLEERGIPADMLSDLLQAAADTHELDGVDLKSDSHYGFVLLSLYAADLRPGL